MNVEIAGRWPEDETARVGGLETVAWKLGVKVGTHIGVREYHTGKFWIRHEHGNGYYANAHFTFLHST